MLPQIWSNVERRWTAGQKTIRLDTLWVSFDISQKGHITSKGALNMIVSNVNTFKYVEQEEGLWDRATTGPRVSIHVKLWVDCRRDRRVLKSLITCPMTVRGGGKFLGVSWGNQAGFTVNLGCKKGRSNIIYLQVAVLSSL